MGDFESFDVEMHNPPCELPRTVCSTIVQAVDTKDCSVCTPAVMRDEAQDQRRYHIVAGHDLRDWVWRSRRDDKLYRGLFLIRKLSRPR